MNRVNPYSRHRKAVRFLTAWSLFTFDPLAGGCFPSAVTGRREPNACRLLAQAVSPWKWLFNLPPSRIQAEKSFALREAPLILACFDALDRLRTVDS